MTTIIRGDGEETYYDEVRLSIVDNKSWGMSRTFARYLTQIGSNGPYGTKRAEIDYYFFCDGRLFAPEGVEEPEAYKAGADEQQKRLLGTAGVEKILGQIGK